jgi:putative ABC transport system substrate-binding protein
MRRRELITLLGTTAFAWPLAVRAQQTVTPMVSFINSETLDLNGHQVVAFGRGLSEAGYVPGKDAVIEYRWAEGRDDRLPALVADIIRRQPSVIVGNTPSALAAKRVTATIPIVFTSGADPVALGLVASLNRPGGNVTGVSFLATKLEAKRLGLLREFLPSMTRIACLIDPKYPFASNQVQDLSEAARAVGLNVEVENASTKRDIERVFGTLASKNVGALLVGAAPLFNHWRDEIVALAAQHALPAIYEWREFAEAGGLIAYGASLPDSYRQAGVYAGRILKGEKPADLPVLQPTKFELVINLKTARALGLTVPPTLLSLADEVIE